VAPSAYTIDASRFPLVVGSASEHVRDDSALGETYRQMSAALARGLPMVVMFDLRGGYSTPPRRKRLVDWANAHDASIKRLVLAIAIVVRTEVERGFVTAVTWLRSPAVETRIFTSTTDAEAWLMKTYRERVR
jgi:hypothetical protein